MVKKNQINSFSTYLKEAFFLKSEIPGMGHLPLNLLACLGFGILGMAHPGFLLLGLGLETGYLLFTAGNSRFQNLVNGKYQIEEKEVWNKNHEELLQNLEVKNKSRYRRLVSECQKIEENMAKNPNGNFETLGELIWTSLKLLISQQKLESTLANTSSKQLNQDLIQTQSQLEKATPDSPLANSLMSNLEIIEKRISNRAKNEENLLVVKAELDRIESQVALLGEEFAISSAPSQMNAKLDGVLKSVQQTSEWMKNQNEMWSTLDTSEPLLNTNEISKSLNRKTEYEN